MRKDAKQEIQRIRKLGYTVEPGKSGHFNVTDSEGRFYGTMSGSPRDKRTLKNQLTRLRRNGAKV
jgi:hypothetical protein